MKRDLPLEDAADRARKKRKCALMRVPLEKIGFWPGNRGGLGCSAYHIHEVAHDCLANKTRLERYGHVDLLEIPKELLDEFREHNRQFCESDPLMPRFSAKMVYVCGGRTHFVHAHKLAKDGNRTLFNKAEGLRIVWKTSDVEGAEIREQGPLCAIYESSIFEDPDAVSALASDGNLNSNVEMGEDEMQAFGRVDAMFERMARSQDTKAGEKPKINMEKLLANIQVSGFGQFSEESWQHLIALRKVLPTAMAKCLQLCQFNAVASRVRVRSSDFGAVAKLDPRAPWAKVALLLWQYLGTLNEKHGSQPSRDDILLTTFSGRKEVFAKSLGTTTMKQLQEETRFLMDVEDEIIKTLKHYNTPDVAGDAVKTGCVNSALTAARGAFLSQCGRYLLKVACALAEAERKALSIRKPITPEQRTRCLDEETKGRFSKLEKRFREILLDKRLFTANSLPEARHPPLPDEVNSSDAKVSAAVAPSQANEACFDGDTQTELNAQHVFARLRISGVGEQVTALLVEQVGAVKAELQSDDENVGGGAVVVKAEPGELIKESKWAQATLVSLDLPHATVEIEVETAGDGSQPSEHSADQNTPPVTQTVKTTVRVHVDDLRPSNCKETPKSRKELHPTLRNDGEEMPLYHYDDFEKPLYISLANHALSMAFIGSQSSVERVRTLRLSAKDKLPLVLQCRALQAFKKGELLLVPSLGEIVLQADHDEAVHKTKKLKTMHESMLSRVVLRVSGGSKDKRLKHASATKERKVVVRSPLLDSASRNPHGTDRNPLSKLNSFWSVLRCLGPHSVPNMEIVTETIIVPQLILSGSRATSKGKCALEFSVDIPVLRNVVAVDAGDILCLEWCFDDGNEGE